MRRLSLHWSHISRAAFFGAPFRAVFPICPVSRVRYVYYKAGLAGQWPFLRVFSAIGRRMAKQRWPMAERAKCEDPRLFTLALEPRR